MKVFVPSHLATRLTPTSRRGLPGAKSQPEGGFTLIELLVVMIILPLIIGALSLGIIAVFSQQAKIAGRLSGSMDLQTLNAQYIRDVESASYVTNDATQPLCGTTGTQLLGLAWNPYRVSGTTQYLTSVSYVEVPTSSGGTPNFNAQLERLFCINGNTSIPASTKVVSSDVSTATVPSTGQTPQGPPIICQGTVSSSNCSTATFSGLASKVAEVDFPLQVPLSTQSFDLVATPRQGAGGNLASFSNFFTPIVLTSPSCGTVLSVNNNATLSINVNHQKGNGVLTVESPCANPITNDTGGGGGGGNGSGSICVSAILSGSTQLGTFTNPAGACPGPRTPPWYHSDDITDPYTALQVPPDPTGSGTCTYSGNTYSCSAGSYTAQSPASSGTFAPATLPTFKKNSTIIFTGGAYSFGSLSLPVTPTFPNGSTVTFYLGTYKFMSSGTAFDASSNSRGTTIIGDGAMFYAPNGDITFGNNDVVTLTPNPGYLGASIWDGPRPSPSCSTSPTLTVSNVGQDSYGGIYVPCGEIATGNVGALTATFIVAGTANFSQSTVINVTSP